MSDNGRTGDFQKFLDVLALQSTRKKPDFHLDTIYNLRSKSLTLQEYSKNSTLYLNYIHRVLQRKNDNESVAVIILILEQLLRELDQKK